MGWWRNYLLHISVCCIYLSPLGKLYVLPRIVTCPNYPYNLDQILKYKLLNIIHSYII